MNTPTLHTSPSQTNFAKWVMAATMTTMHDDDDNKHRKWGERIARGMLFLCWWRRMTRMIITATMTCFPATNTHKHESHVFVECNRLWPRHTHFLFAAETIMTSDYKDSVTNKIVKCFLLDSRREVRYLPHLMRQMLLRMLFRFLMLWIGSSVEWSIVRFLRWCSPLCMQKH